MSLFRQERREFSGSPTYNPFNNPSVPLQSVAFDSVYGLLQRQNNESGEKVTVDRALAIPTVWRCIGLLSTVIAGCPLLVYNKKKELQVIPVLDPNNTSTTYTQYELWELAVAHLCLFGNAYIRKIRNDGDMITDLVPVNPALIKTTRCAKDGRHTDGKDFAIEHYSLNGTLDYIEHTGNWEIMHIPGQGYDGLTGLAPLQIAAQTYGTALAADKLAARFFSRGTALTGILNVKAPLTDQEQANEIKRRWREVNAGSGHGGDIAVLDAETTFQQLTIPPDQLQFLESREWEAAEIAKMYGVPPHLIGDSTKATSWGSGIESINVGFVAYTVAGYTCRIEQRVAREIVNTRGQRSIFDLTELMKGSTSERFTAYMQGIQAGWLTRNEARVKEDMIPIKGLDEPLLPLNMVPNDLAGTQVPTPGAVAPTTPPAPSGSDTKQLEDEQSS